MLKKPSKILKMMDVMIYLIVWYHFVWHAVYIPNLNVHYAKRQCQACHLQDDYTIEYCYRVSIFYAVIDFRL